MLSRIARRFHLPEEKLRSRLGSLRRESRARRCAPHIAVDAEQPTTTAVPKLNDLVAWDRELLELLILEPSFITRVASEIEPEALTSPAANRIYAACCRFDEAGTEDLFGQLLTAFDDPDVKNLLVQLDESCATKTAADRQRWLADLLETHRRRARRSDMPHRPCGSPAKFRRSRAALGPILSAIQIQTPQRIRKEKKVVVSGLWIVASCKR